MFHPLPCFLSPKHGPLSSTLAFWVEVMRLGKRARPADKDELRRKAERALVQHKAVMTEVEEGWRHPRALTGEDCTAKEREAMQCFAGLSSHQELPVVSRREWEGEN